MKNPPPSANAENPTMISLQTSLYLNIILFIG